jgi:hypothetical protein
MQAFNLRTAAETPDHGSARVLLASTVICTGQSAKETERTGKFLRRQCNTRQGTFVAVASHWKQDKRLKEGFWFRRSTSRVSEAAG